MSFMNVRRVAATLFISILAAACGDSTQSRPVATVVVTPAERALSVGDEVVLSARALDASGAAVEGRSADWSSSNASIATVTAGGRVKAISPGNVLIRATVDGKYAQAALVIAPTPVARVDVDPGSVTLGVGESLTLVAKPFDKEGNELRDRTVMWVSRDSSVAAIDQTGRLFARRPGSIVVTAIVDSHFVDVTVVVTRVAVASIAVTPAPIVLDVGKARQLTALVFDAAGNRLTDRVVQWTTDFPAVAIVSANGLVSATGPGYATITARSEGKSFSVAVTVSNGESEAMPYDLVYHRTMPGIVGEIMILGAANGSVPARLNAGNVSRQPAPSPDGNRIAFYVSQRELTGEQTDDIFAVDRNGMNMKRLTSEPGYDGEPAWSPAGDRIAYRRIDPATGRSDIWLMNADGSQKVKLTGDLPANESVGAPNWSPDGTRIAFAATTSGVAGYTSGIWVMNANGSSKLRVATSVVAGDRNPTWSPDGSRIAFIRVFGAETDIAVVDVAGGTVTRIELPGNQEGPAWSPDGRHFAFWQQIDGSGSTGIYSVRVDGSNVRLHTVDPNWGGGYSPRWIRR